MPERTILVWFRNDLRIHDNEILSEALRKSTSIVPVYCLDPRLFGPTRYGTRKTGSVRARFLLESVGDLKKSLQQLGGDLLVFTGKPEEILPEVARKYQVHEVYHHREVAAEETEVSGLTETALWKQQINLRHFIGHTLYHKEDLPFPIKDIPDVFSSFRKKTERESGVRTGFDTPSAIRTPVLEHTEIPTLASLGLDEPIISELSVMSFTGGETEGLKRLQEYFWEKDRLKDYKSTRNGLIGADYSSKLSPWIALGCLSVRKVYWEARKYERERGAGDSTYALIFELLWRDYFRFMFKKHGNRFFMEGGLKNIAPARAPDEKAKFERWKSGTTGQPFVDANMKELDQTGWMSNRGRQVTASYLVKNLGVNWTWGAAWFEERLIDYSPASNWGNWAYVAGVGNDSRENRQFNALKQGLEYDPKGEYVRRWLPELASIPGGMIHKPTELSELELSSYRIDPLSPYLAGTTALQRA